MMTARTAAHAWGHLLAKTREAFSAPGFGVFETLMAGWAMSPEQPPLVAGFN